MKRNILFCGCFVILFSSHLYAGRLFEVGPGQSYANIGDVPLETIIAGDTVQIYWRAEPYREKWVISAQGTEIEPVIFRGIPGPQGQLPVIDGENAVTRTQLSYWNEGRSVIKIGGSSYPSSDPIVQYITIENLDIRGARPPATFTDDSGVTQSYNKNAAAVHIEIAENITIRNCILRDSGNGLFVSSGETDPSRNILIEGNYIHSNGNVGSDYEHNTYTAAIGIIYQFNRFGPLADGAGGNNLKDRSAGLIVRSNWIESGNRQLDLVDAEDSSLIQTDPSYGKTFVYGNILIEPDGAGNRQIVHYGGDSGQTSRYRKGKLYFYHNTVISTRVGRTTLFRLSTMMENCDARNNIFYVTDSGDNLGVLDADGVIDLSCNWLKPGWQDYFDSYSGIVNDDGTQIETASPGFMNLANQDYYLASSSVCINQSGPLHTDAAAYPLEYEYVVHQQSRPRFLSGAAADIGAWERLLPDYNDDKIVNLSDFSEFSKYWFQDTCNSDNLWCQRTDLDQNRITDSTDLEEIASYWLFNLSN